MKTIKQKLYKKIAGSEIGAVRKKWRQRIRVALVYPNTYHVGMSNLGFHTVYQLLNNMEHVVCERAFLPENSRNVHHRIETIESGRSIKDFDIIAFSVSFESDYLNILSVLMAAGIPLFSSERNSAHPLVVSGGVASFINPEPVAPFIDCFLIGEAEAILPDFINSFEIKTHTFRLERQTQLKQLADYVPGVYVPEFYKPAYNKKGELVSFEPVCDVPHNIKKVLLDDLSETSTCTSILTPYTSFKQTYLIETGRGCAHGCRFCTAGYIYRPPRSRPLSLLKKSLAHGCSLTDRIGLVGTATSDHPEIISLCSEVPEKVRISFSSIRADALSPELIAVLRNSRVKTATIAPDAGSQRMRNVINKGFTEETIIHAAEKLVDGNIPNLKLYFMTGLPTETSDDIDAVIMLCKKIKQKFLDSSRIKKRIGNITVSLCPFIPKPFTPFQWAPSEEITVQKKKISVIKEGLKKTANLRVHADSPYDAFVQSLLSRGNRKIADLLLLAMKNHWNSKKILKSLPDNLKCHMNEERPLDELFPWDFIDHKIKKTYLKKEYQKAVEGKISPPCKIGSCNICGACG